MESENIDIVHAANYICLLFSKEKRKLYYTQLQTILFLCEGHYLATENKKLFSKGVNFAAAITHTVINNEIHKKFRKESGPISISVIEDYQWSVNYGPIETNSKIKAFLESIVNMNKDIEFTDLVHRVYNYRLVQSNRTDFDYINPEDMKQFFLKNIFNKNYG